MSQSGYTTLQTYYSNTAGHVPTSANLSSGELAVNIVDGKLFYKDSNGNVQILATNNVANGVFTNVTITGTATVNNAVISNSTITTGNTVNFRSSNVAITGGNIAVTNASATNLSTCNATITGGNVTANLVSANAQITGGSISNVSITFDSINNTPIGNSAPSTGRFTTISASNSIVVGANSTPISVLINATDALGVPVGNTVQEPANAAAGYLRFNTDTVQFEGYNGSVWGGIGGAQAGGAIITNNQTATVNYTITSTQNGFSVGPVSVANGVVITISAGSRWAII